MPDKPIRTPDDISRSEQILPTGPIGQGEKGPAASTPEFASFMKGAPGMPSEATRAGMVSPFDLAHGQVPVATGPTLDTLMAQVSTAHGTLGDISNQLSYPNLKLKPSAKYVLKNKLTDANENILTANARLGTPAAETPPVTITGPIGKFLGYVTSGMTQLEGAKQQIQALKDKGENMSPGDLLLVQIKMNKAQQLLDFSSVLLSKAVEDFKMLMQVQL